MKRGFTLLELLIVVVIIGMLATLAVGQYQSSLERSRAAEAKQTMGTLRTSCAQIYTAEGSGNNCSSANLRIGTGSDYVPSACRSTYYFSYSAAGAADGVTLTATRCTSGGKAPQGDGGTLTLTVDFTSGDTWGGTGGYY